MRERVAYRRLVLAICRELRPVMRDRLLIIDKPALRLHMQRGRRDRLGHREDREQRIAVDPPPRRLIRKTAPRVYDEFAVEVRGDLHADLAALGYRGID